MEISEIAAVASKDASNRAETSDSAELENNGTDVNIAEKPQEPAEPAAERAAPVEPSAEAGAGEPVALPVKNPSDSGKTVHSDYALRVAHIMRSYLSIRPSSSGGGGADGGCGGGSGDAAGDRCKAMMEVVRAENGRWSVSRVILEHSHSMSSPDPTGGGILPTVGMNFESISMAKAFYIAYSEKMGFKVRTGSGRRSKGTRMLIMQRFFCSKGNYLANTNGSDKAAIKRKRGPYRKRAGKKDGEGVEVIQVESSDERSGDVANEIQEKNGLSGEKDGALVPPEQQLGEDATKNGEKEKVPLVGNPSQSRLLRELGIRVSKYTNEERRDIIRRYMKKRNNRQVVDRSIKVII